jgi:hypothetical protein
LVVDEGVALLGEGLADSELVGDLLNTLEILDIGKPEAKQCWNAFGLP